MLLNFLFIHWNINPNVPMPNFMPFKIQWYGIMWSLSILSCFYVGQWILRNEKMKENHLVLIIQYIFIGAIVGARLGDVFFYRWSYYSNHLWEIPAVWNGGLASHGGVIGGLIGAVLVFIRLRHEYRLLWLLDSTALLLPIPCAFIRFGNLLNSELCGKPTNVAWAFIFGRVDNVPRHPVVLYESIAYTILFFVILEIYKRFGRIRQGFYVALFFISIFSVRFLIEFLKEPEGTPIIPFISRTQFFSLPFIAVGIILLVYIFTQKKAQNEV